MTSKLPMQIERSAPMKVTGRLKRAIDAMIWQGLKRYDAAQSAQLTDHALYTALKRPHVMRYYLAECEVLRASTRAKNINRLAEIRDHANNQPAVNAIKALEQIADDDVAHRSALHETPGLTIQIVNLNPNNNNLPSPVAASVDMPLTRIAPQPVSRTSDEE